RWRCSRADIGRGRLVWQRHFDAENPCGRQIRPAASAERAGAGLDDREAETGVVVAAARFVLPPEALEEAVEILPAEVGGGIGDGDAPGSRLDGHLRAFRSVGDGVSDEVLHDGRPKYGICRK